MRVGEFGEPLTEEPGGGEVGRQRGRGDGAGVEAEQPDPQGFEAGDGLLEAGREGTADLGEFRRTAGVRAAGFDQGRRGRLGREVVEFLDPAAQPLGLGGEPVDLPGEFVEVAPVAGGKGPEEGPGGLA